MRRTFHRRRFHTDRIVRDRRERYLREVRPRWRASDVEAQLAYGRLVDRDPWDCGHRCLLCHWDKLVDPRRAREQRAWRREWTL